MIPVIVLQKKDDESKYLASDIEYGDHEGNVTIDNIKEAYLIVRHHDLMKPTQDDFEAHKQMHAEHKKFMHERFGENAFIGLDFEGVCEAYEPVNIEITQEQYKYAQSLWEE